ncbi:tetraspanin-18B-like [Littorina saxatilis]|uniref:Tetraspanin n=1 Tax=Littorina saxatilis TaxID=31220 RepID=A0AAN9BGP3_9CAEN
MSTLIIAQGVVGGLFIAEDTVLHDEIKKTVGDKVKNDFQANGTDVFDFSINMLHYLLDCCGIRGWDDFNNTPKPPSCCNRTIIDGDSSWDDERQECASDPPTAPDSYYNQEGCYVVLQDKILEHLTLIAVAFAVILFIQLLEVIFACLIVKDVNNADSKVGPY